MAFKFVILLLPALAYARVNVQLSGEFDENNPNLNLDYFGNEVDIISNSERSTFKLSDSSLKAAVGAYFGKRPDDAYLRSPTPWRDLYKTYGWQQVLRTLEPRSAKFLGISSEPSIVMEQVFENNSTKPATFNVGISQEVTNTVSSSWSKGGSLSIGQEIEYGFDIEVAKAGGKTSFDYTASWGEDYQKSQSVTVGATSALEVTLEPGQAVIAQLHATRGYITVEVNYRASLNGASAVNYADTYKGHHFWGLDVRAVMSSGGLSNDLPSSETIRIGFYARSKVVLLDKNTKDQMMAVYY